VALQDKAVTKHSWILRGIFWSARRTSCNGSWQMNALDWVTSHPNGLKQWSVNCRRMRPAHFMHFLFWLSGVKIGWHDPKNTWVRVRPYQIPHGCGWLRYFKLSLGLARSGGPKLARWMKKICENVITPALTYDPSTG
jgi:hypothetical protein